ncbi:hypothetical protein ACIRYZ_44305 [Kitasatospora sp. NPDC101155]|uniref:hypothetical protein n=1 Tax=Kitasatospora sp. NPDC101155 TaxID=3364097 RepID=UPI0038234038
MEAAHQGGDAGGEGGGAQVEVGQELGGEVEFVVGRLGVSEGADEGELRLGGGAPPATACRSASVRAAS